MNKNAVTIIAVIIVGGLAFFGGTYYQENKTENEIAEFSNLTPEERQERVQSGEGFPGGARRRPGGPSQRPGGFGGGAFGASLEGTIDKIEDDQIIITTERGSQTIKLSDDVAVGLASDGNLADLQEGSTILIKINREDDELTAERITQLQD